MIVDNIMEKLGKLNDGFEMTTDDVLVLFSHETKGGRLDAIMTTPFFNSLYRVLGSHGNVLVEEHKLKSTSMKKMQE